MNRMPAALAFFSSVALALFADASLLARAEPYYGRCISSDGIAVDSYPDTSVNDIAMATRVAGVPVILYNPQVVAQASDATRTFFYFHECAHHALGHTLGASHPLVREQEADCWAARTLRDNGTLTETVLSRIQNDLALFGRADWSHLPGPQRAINLERCLLRVGGGGGEGGSERWIETRQACTHPAHPEGDVSPCTHPAHYGGDVIPCQHACPHPMNPYVAVPCHSMGDSVLCQHPAHPYGDRSACAHRAHPEGHVVRVPRSP